MCLNFAAPSEPANSQPFLFPGGITWSTGLLKGALINIALYRDVARIPVIVACFYGTVASFAATNTYPEHVCPVSLLNCRVIHGLGFGLASDIG